MLTDSNLEKNSALWGVTLYLLLTSVNTLGATTFIHNMGSLYLFICNIIFSGHTLFQRDYNMELSNSTPVASTITSILSNVMFAFTTSLIGNNGDYGGAVLAIESTISISGEMMVADNTATHESGGFSLHQSHLEFTQTPITCSLIQIMLD